MLQPYHLAKTTSHPQKLESVQSLFNQLRLFLKNYRLLFRNLFKSHRQEALKNWTKNRFNLKRQARRSKPARIVGLLMQTEQQKKRNPASVSLKLKTRLKRKPRKQQKILQR